VRLVSFAAEAMVVTELIVYDAGAVAPASVALMTLLSELLALRASPDAIDPSELKSVATDCTEVCNWPRRLSLESTVASLFWSAVIGICAIATARFRTFCKSLEYWLTPFRVTGAKGDVAAAEVVPRDDVLVLILPSIKLIDGSGEKSSKDFSAMLLNGQADRVRDNSIGHKIDPHVARAREVCGYGDVYLIQSGIG
jgi:hypothetical protein